MRVPKSTQRLKTVNKQPPKEKPASKQTRTLALVHEHNPHPILRVSARGQILYANAAAAPLLQGWKLEVGEQVPPDCQPAIRAALASGASQDLDITINRRTFAQVFSPIRDAGYVNVYALDVTAHKQAEEKLRRLNRTLQALASSDRALLHAACETDYLNEVCRIIVEKCGYKMVWVGYAQDDDAKSVLPVAYAGFDKGYIDTLNISWGDSEQGRGPTGTAIRTGQVCQCREMLSDPQFGPWRARALQSGFASSAVFPLIAGGRAFGALTIYFEKAEALSRDEVNLLTDLADNFALGISTLRLRTEHARTAETLRISEEQLRLFIKHAPAAIAMLDTGMRYIIASERWLTDYGLAGQDLRGRSHYEIFPEIPEHWKAIHRRCLEGAVEHANEAPLVRSDGRTQWIRWEIRPWQTAGGAVGGIMIFSEDITSRKQSEEALAEANDVLRTTSAVLQTRNEQLATLSEHLRLTNEKLEERVVERTAQLRSWPAS